MAGLRTRQGSMVRVPFGCDAKTRRDAATTCDSSAIARAHARQRQSAISRQQVWARGVNLPIVYGFGETVCGVSWSNLPVRLQPCYTAFSRRSAL